MAIPDLNKLCTPAQLYLFITLFSLVIMIYQNAGTHDNVLCVGNYECHNAPNKAVLVFVKLLYIGFWTFVLQMICKGGYKNVSWFLVLLPVILFMLILIFGMGPWNYKSSMIEGMTNLSDVKTAKDGANFVSDKINKLADVRIKMAESEKNENEKITKEDCRKRIITFANAIKDAATNAASEVPATSPSTPGTK